MGHLSRDVGDGWEQAIENKLAVLHQLGVIAWVEHQQPELFSLGVVRRGPRVIQAWGKGAPSGADYSGVLGRQSPRPGLAFALEAKSVGPKEGRDRSLVYEDEISPTQIDHLNAVARAGALAVLAVQFRRQREPWLLAAIPWAEVPWERERVKHHLRAEDCAAWRIPTGRTLFEHLLLTDGAGAKS